MTARSALGLLGGVALAACGPRRPPAPPAFPGEAPAAFEGIASWYGSEYEGRRTASGERFDPDDLTAAHFRLPFGTHVQVTNLDNGRTVVVRINDRMPRRDRVIDVSRAAARTLGLIGPGTAKVRVDVVD